MKWWRMTGKGRPFDDKPHLAPVAEALIFGNLVTGVIPPLPPKGSPQWDALRDHAYSSLLQEFFLPNPYYIATDGEIRERMLDMWMERHAGV